MEEYITTFNIGEYDDIAYTIKTASLANVINNKDSRGDSFIHYALKIANPERKLYVVKCLLEHKIDPNITGEFDQTSLLIASRLGYYDCVQILLDYGANPNLYDHTGDSPLLWSSFYGYLDVVKHLVENGADVDYKYPDGRSALLWAIERDNHNVVEYLLNFLKNVNTVDKYNKNMMNMAKSFRVKQLLENHIVKNKLYLLKAVSDLKMQYTDYQIVGEIFKFYFNATGSAPAPPPTYC